MNSPSKGQVGTQRQLTPEQLRIKALEKEVAHLREVNEIVKKAHVYFVHQSK
jgi:transposase